MNKGKDTKIQKIFNHFTTLKDIVYWVQGWIGLLLFIALTSVITLQISSRYIFHTPVLWTEEVARYLFLWVVMMGAAVSVQTERHFSIEFFEYKKVKNIHFRKFLMLVPHICFTILALIMVILGSQYVEMSKMRMGQLAHINMKFVFVSIPISGVTIILYSLHHMIRILLQEETTQDDEALKPREN